MMDLTWSIIADEYCDVCYKASQDDNEFFKFRSNPIYKKVVEHSTKELGAGYLESIKRDNKLLLDFIDKFKTSDYFGTPLIYDYDGILISPSTLRYIKILSDLIKYFGTLDGFNIAEIGGGYGGQCKIIQDVFFVNYHMVDLPQVNMLARRYLKETGYKNVRFSTWDSLKAEEYDLVVSVGAFTEMNREIQDHYYEMIIKGSKRGYMMGSIELNPNNCYQIEDLKKMGNVIFTDEEPNTHPTNFIMYWK